MNETSSSAGAGESSLLPIESLDANLSIEDAKLYLQSLISRDKEIENELKQYIQMKDDIESQMEIFDLEIPEYLQLSLKKSNELTERISATCELAETLSSKVKKVDHVRDRIKETLKKVDDIVDLKNCIEGVQMAISREEYETASFHIHRYLNIDKSVLDEASSEKLSSAEKKLLTMIEDRYNEALGAGNQEGVLRFCKLYVPLEKADIGVDKYCNYLKSHSTRLENIISHYQSYIANPKTIKPISAVASITKVFEHYASQIEDHLDLIKTEFGLHFAPHFILSMSQQCDTYATKVYDSFNEQFQIQKNVDQVLLYKQQLERSGGYQQQHQEKIDPRSFAQALDETVMISKATKFYEKYLLKKENAIKEEIKQELVRLNNIVVNNSNKINSNGEDSNNSNNNNQDNLSSSSTTTTTTTIDPLKIYNNLTKINLKQSMYSSTTKQKMNQLLGNYILLEEYFMVESVNKAIQMENQPSISNTTPLSSSSTTTTTNPQNTTANSSTSDNNMMVDFIFFVLQKSLQRSLESQQIQTLNIIINRLCRILVQNKENLQRTFREQIIRSNSKSNIDYHQPMITLNNIETSSEYILRLKKELDTKSEKIFNLNPKQQQQQQQQQQQHNEEKDQINLLSTELANCSKSYTKLLQEEIDSFFKSIQPRLKNVLFQFTNVSYEINQVEYDNNDINDPFAHQFTMDISVFLKPFKEHLSQTNYDLVVHHTLHFLLKKIEAALFQKHFTLLGGLQFGKDLRTISNFSTKICQSSTRDKFYKLNQMSSFLILENLAQVQEFWQENSQNSTWKLSSQEVKKLLALRLDFNQDKISKLNI
ncbi:hypothetical protein CYY_002351 [Polysphondylium violaceum]|uniref:Conserved oligomeric Golgi complex subunit 4 n=1 Tax=Polysphondylium violaceum TaxID=133409 RepID=A0A8J4PZ90_9MYCE|nr:hypothetical protein CYY_002351 [Polysphondylium violaceum]